MRVGEMGNRVGWRVSNVGAGWKERAGRLRACL